MRENNQRVCVRARVCRRVVETVIDCDTLYGQRQQEHAHTDVICDQFRIPLSVKLRAVVHDSRLRCQLDVHSLCSLH